MSDNDTRVQGSTLGNCISSHIYLAFFGFLHEVLKQPPRNKKLEETKLCRRHVDLEPWLSDEFMKDRGSHPEGYGGHLPRPCPLPLPGLLAYWGPTSQTAPSSSLLSEVTV